MKRSTILHGVLGLLVLGASPVWAASDERSTPVPTASINASPKQVQVQPADAPEGNLAGPDGVTFPDAAPQGLGIAGLASVEPSTGVARTGYAFDIPKARGDISVALGLGYNSSMSDEGDAGVGWSLSLPVIERRGPGGTVHPMYQDPPVGRGISTVSVGPGGQDQFVYNGEPLVPICYIGGGEDPIKGCIGHPSVAVPSFATSGGWHFYRLQTSGEDALRFYWSRSHNTWVVESPKRGEVLEFGEPRDDRASLGNTVDVELLPQPGTSAPYRWHLSRRYDLHSGSDGSAQNVAYYAWDADGSLSDIYYTPKPGFSGGQGWQNAFAHHIRLNYEAHDHTLPAGHYLPQWRRRPVKRLLGLDVASAAASGSREQVRRYHLSYQSAEHQSYLTSIQEEGRCSTPIAEDAAGTLPSSSCPRLPARTFEYSPASPNFAAPITSMGSLQFGKFYGAALHFMDVNSDGRADVLKFDQYIDSGAPPPHSLHLNEITQFAHTLMTFDLDGNVNDRPDSQVMISAGDLNPTNFGDLNAGGFGRLIETPWFCGGTIPAHCDHPTDYYTQFFFFPFLDLNTSQWSWSTPWVTKEWWRDGSFNATKAYADIDGDGFPDRLVFSSHIEHPTPSTIRKVIDATGTAFSHKDTHATVWPYGIHDGSYFDATSHVGQCPNNAFTNGLQDSLDRADNKDPDKNPFLFIEDMDGDHLPDMVQVGGNAVVYWPGRGDGWWGLDACTGDSSSGLTCSCTAPPAVIGGGPTIVNPYKDHVAVHDVTGDGLADLITWGPTDISVWQNVDGAAFSGPHVFDVASLAGWDPDDSDEDKKTMVLFADMNGSGVDDIVVAVGPHAAETQIYYIDVSGEVRPGLLHRVHSEQGADTTIDYGTVSNAEVSGLATHPWISHSPQPTPIVRAVTVQGGGAISRTTYKYDDPEYDTAAREFRGFRHVRTTHEGDGTLPTLVDDTLYAIGLCGSATICPGNTLAIWGPRDETIRSLPTLTDTFSVADDGSLRYISTTHRTYRLRGLELGMLRGDLDASVSDKNDAFIVALEQEDTWLYDDSTQRKGVTSLALDDVRISDVHLPTVQSTVTVYGVQGDGTAHVHHDRDVNPEGLVGSQTDWGNDWAPLPDRAIWRNTTWQDVGTSVHPGFWRPQQEQVGDLDQPGARRSTYFTFNSAGDLTGVSADLDGTVALQRRHEDPTRPIAPTPADASAMGPHRVVLSLRDVDGLGHVRHVQSGPRCTDIDYTSDPFGEFPSTVTGYSGTSAGGCGDLPLTTMTSWDRGLGVPVMTVGPNGDTTTFEYEAFGRQAKVFAPNPSIPGMSMNMADSIVEYFDDPAGQRIHARRMRATGQYQDTWTHLDALGRTLATIDAADPAAGDAAPWVLHGLTDRSPSGAPIRTYQGEFWTGDPSSFDPGYHSIQPFERTEYDWAGRAAKQYGLDGAPGVAVEYHPQYRLTRDAEQLDPTSPHASLGTRTNIDGHGRTTDTVVTVQGSTGVDTITTHVDYQATGEPSRITRQGAGGTYSRTMQYDSLGRLVQNNEPNAGTWLYAYNDSGDLVATSDPRGCGVNLSYTASGEKLAEDVSPCLSSQPDYTAPDLASGDGTEAFLVYGGAASLTAAGRLTDTYDRGAHTQFAYDVRGRLLSLSRHMARPGAAAPTLSARYGHQRFSKTFGYGADDSLTQESTGADVDVLLNEDGASAVTAAYSLRGLPAQIGSSYGALISRAVYDFDGLPRETDYGDAAATKATYAYDVLRRVQESTLGRAQPAPIWSRGTSTYDPPARNETAQLALAHHIFHYDRVGNPMKVDDPRDPGEWPVGAKPVTLGMQYDDLYRLTQVTYNSGGDAFSPPLASGTGGRVDNSVPYTSTANRVQSQSFAYDYMGNITKSTDDANLLFDRSLGTVQYQPSHPNQVAQTGPRVDGSGTDFVAASYDPAGNLGALVVQRTGAPCGDARAGCTQLFAYDWDEVGQLARARRWDYIGPYSASAPAYPVRPSETPAADLSFAYDSSGQRTLKANTQVVRHGSSETKYSVEIFNSLRLDGADWDENDNEYQNDELTETTYLTLGGRLFGRVVFDQDLPTLVHGRLLGQHVFMHLTDHLGSVSSIIDRETGELVEQSTYQAYGAPETDYRPARWRSFREQYRFTGKEDDIQVGVTYFGARYYSAALGQWVSPDPETIHGLGADLNPYAYVHGRVSSTSDPFGLQEAPDPATDFGAPMPATDCAGASCLTGAAKVSVPSKNYYVFVAPQEVAYVERLQTHTTAQERYDAAKLGMLAEAVQMYNWTANLPLKAIVTVMKSWNITDALNPGDLPGPADPGGDQSTIRSQVLHENFVAGGNVVQVAALASPFAGEGLVESLGVASRSEAVDNALSAVGRFVADTAGSSPGGGASNRGVATVFRNSEGHSSVLVRVGNESLHTEQQIVHQLDRTMIREVKDVGKVVESVEVSLPDAKAAMRYQREVMRTLRGPFNFHTNSCVTHCGDVLRAGGLSEVPTRSIRIGQWLRGQIE